MHLAEPTGLEPATSGVTGQRSNQLSYDSNHTLIPSLGYSVNTLLISQPV